MTGAGRAAARRFKVLVPALLAVLGALSCLFAYWSADTAPPVEGMRGRAVHVLPDPDGGASVLVEWTARLARPCAGISYRWVVGSYITPLPPLPVPPVHPSELGRVMTWRINVEVPPGVEDAAAYRIHMLFQCNPLHRLSPIAVDPPDVPFRVEPGQVAERPGRTNR